MHRRTFDVVISAGGVVIAVTLLVLGMVLQSNATFAKDYVSDQLGRQKISFKAADTLTDEEKKSACLNQYAGKALTTGRQAECYANEFIGLHLKTIPSSGGKTYAELGAQQTDLRGQIAQTPQGSATLPVLQKQLTDVTAARETVFKGETLRGLLLTSYGFSIFGEKAAQAATVADVLGGLLAVLSIAGVVHAFTVPRERMVRMPGAEGTIPPHRHVAAPKRSKATDNGDDRVSRRSAGVSR